MKTPPTSRKKGRSEERVRSLDALDRANVLIHRIEAQCAVLQAAARSPEAEGIGPAVWTEALAVISDNASRLKRELGQGMRPR